MILDLSTRALARHLETHTTIDSTNTRAKTLAASNAPHGTCVVAQAQTQGRGQRDRHWASPAGAGLYASFLLRPKLLPQQTPMLTLATAVAACDAIKHVCSQQVGIKWPNDLLARESKKKLAGILVEASSNAEKVNYAIIGIGINLKPEAFPTALREYAGALEELSTTSVEPSALLSALANELEPWLDRLENGASEPLIEAWRNRAIGRGQTVEFVDDDRIIEGTLDGIAPSGGLIIAGQTYYSGELRLPGAPQRPPDFEA